MEKFAEFVKRHADASGAVILFFATLLFFLPGINFSPVPLDDQAYIGAEYLLFPTWQNFLYHLKTPVLDLYSPLVMHSFMLDYLLWGKELLQAGGRFHNILLHCLNTVMFFYLLRQIRIVRSSPEKPFTLSLPAAIFGAVCFALHPQRVESVIWIVERKDVLAIFFGLSSMLCFIHSFRKNRLPLAGAILYFLSFGAKPLIITLPGVLLLGIWAGTERFDWKKTLKMLCPYLAAMLFYIGLNAMQLKNFAGNSAAGVLDWSRLQIVIQNYTFYFFKTIMPLGIQPLYPKFVWNSTTLVLCIMFWLMTAAVLAAAIIKWKYRNIFLGFAAPLLLIYLGVTLPMAGFKSIGNAEFTDRYSYFPAIFIWLGMAALCEYTARRKTNWQYLFPAYAALIAILGFCCLQTWQSKESFIVAALGDGKNVHPAALRLAAWSCFENGDFEQAGTFANHALVLADDFRREEDELFALGMQGLIELKQNNLNGLAKLDAAVTTPAWGRFMYSSIGFAERVLMTAAEYHLKINTPQDVEFARQCYLVLADISTGRDPLKELSFQAYAAYLAKDYVLAEQLTGKALQLSPNDKVLLDDAAFYRKKAAGTN